MKILIISCYNSCSNGLVNSVITSWENGGHRFEAQRYSLRRFTTSDHRLLLLKWFIITSFANLFECNITPTTNILCEIQETMLGLNI